jgi:uncharacterized protein
MIPALTSLIVLQQLDTAAESARKRLAELPRAEQEVAAKLAAATAAVDVAKAKLAANNTARRELEKNVAAVDTRLAKFDDHKAAVKTNQEYTALLHEIATAKSEKDTIEEQILVIMEAADAIAAEIKLAEAALAATTKDALAARRILADERATLETDAARLMADRAKAAPDVPATVLSRYEQLLKQRRMIAVAEMVGELCTACHVRMRPAVAQAVRRNSEIIACDSCQRILYFKPSETAVASSPPS